MTPRISVGDAGRRFLVWSSTPAGLALLFCAGFVIRLILARGGGFPFDISSFSSWADRLAQRGPWNFYPEAGEKFFVDYPPGYLYVLWLLGVVTRAVGGGAPSVFWLKLPPILADLGLAWIVGSLAVRLLPASRKQPSTVRGLAVSGVLLNPAVFFVSAVWGQADVFLALLVTAAYLLLGTGTPSFRREAGGVALLAVAIGTKPQGAFVLPVVALLLLWRHMRTRVGERHHGGLFVGGIAGGLARVFALGGVGAAAGLLLLAPFRMWPVEAFRFYARASSTYAVTSVFAFNGWGVVGFWRPDVGAQGLRIFGVSAFFWGLALFSILGAAVLARAWLSLQAGEDEGRVLLFGSAAITLVGFVVLTRIHERYLFLPLALLAVFVATRWLRRAFVVISALYLINVFFPYVYYLKYVGRPAPTLGGFVDVFYGTDTNGAQLRLLSALTTVACLFVVARGWRALTMHDIDVEPIERAEPPAPAAPVEPRRWSFELHGVGRRGALLAFVAFLVALGTRLPGLGHPPGMYFDEVYHARTGAEYIGGKEVFEWTHPPLAKEVIALSVRGLSGFRARDGGRLGPGVRPQYVTSRPEGFVWAETKGEQTLLHSGQVDDSCSLVARGPPSAPLALQPLAIASAGTAVFVAGVDRAGPTIVRLDYGEVQWSAPLAQRPRDVVALGDRAFVLTADGALVSVSAVGEPKTLAVRAGAIAAESGADPKRGLEEQDRVVGALPQAAVQRGVVWASFPQDARVASWDADGNQSAVIDVAGAPNAIVAPDDTDRLLVATGVDLAVVDTKTKDVTARLGMRPDRLATVPETEIAWAVVGRRMHAIEPRSSVVIGNVTLQREPVALVPDPVRHRLVAISTDRLECASGRPQFAWRLGSAVAGSAMVGLVALLALRLFGSYWVAGLALLFLAVEGLAFTTSRIAIPESYTTAFLLAAWFSILSAFYWWRSSSSVRPGRAAVGWLLATGAFGGLSVASKWVALYGYAAIGLLVLWDAFARGKDGLWGVGGGFYRSLSILALCLGAVPVAVYVATYIPYFSLGHSIGDLVRLQAQMYGYHANLHASHPFSSPWFGWPFGYRAVFLYLGGSGAERAEIWTIPNLVVFWGGLFGLASMAIEAKARRVVAFGVVVLAGVVQVIPWMIVTRVLFLYHYLPVVPFLAIALAWWLVHGLHDVRHRMQVAVGVAVLAVAYFVAVLPMLEGWTMPVSYLERVRDVLPWVIP